ncbi:hypothetical protein QR77_23560 [Streptomyces sp. 150FB]|uniref:hypothetical protein n=1 Tax=Streptomyces sp. 150FB TaxID=1576605 RepID=UPI0005892E36|nr:hypothetical protein [Streptomyces sp. 150FB]KIF76062.1 hypothetical protein QR77_23560 [Streptomyces sp. 150FB]
MARVTVEIDEEFLADIRARFRVETDEAAVRAAVVDAAKYQRRQEFFDAIDSGTVDLTYDSRNDHGHGRSAA